MAQSVLQKNWYTIQAPEEFDRQEVAKTPADSPSQVVGRKVTEALEDLREGSSKYYMQAVFKVTEVEGNKAFTRLEGIEVDSEFTSRMVRTGSDRVDVVTNVETSDGSNIKVKFVGATQKNTSSNKLGELRKTIETETRQKASETGYAEFMEMIYEDKLQEELKDATEDIYGLRALEVRKTQLQ
jgi:small subunit ribosomal protein S3Ae